MKSTLLFVCVVLACCTCFVSSAPTVITAPFVNIGVPDIGIPEYTHVSAPFTSVRVGHPHGHLHGHPRVSTVYPGVAYAHSTSYYPSYYPASTYYSSVHPFSSVHIGWIVDIASKTLNTTAAHLRFSSHILLIRFFKCNWPQWHLE